MEVEDGPIFEFQSEIEIIRFVKGNYILVSLKDDNDLAIINISKELKVYTYMCIYVCGLILQITNFHTLT